LFGKQNIETYDSKIDPSCTVEFMQAAARFTHFFVRPNMKLLDVNGNVREIPTSDTTGKSEILEKSFEDSVRGALNQSLNLDQYSDEVTSFKKSNIEKKSYSFFKASQQVF
jgi:Animal haem peroxidase